MVVVELLTNYLKQMSTATTSLVEAELRAAGMRAGAIATELESSSHGIPLSLSERNIVGADKLTRAVGTR